MSDREIPEPYPYWKSKDTSPFSLRCREIDIAAENITSADEFIQNALADEQLSKDYGGFAFFKKPNKSQINDGICPAYVGHWNGGLVSSVVCSLAPQQLHVYCELKLCEKGRRVYCPIWKERGNEN